MSMQPTRIYVILIILGIHLLIGFLAYVFASKDGGKAGRRSPGGKTVFLLSREHPAISATFGALGKDNPVYAIGGASIKETAETLEQIPSLDEAQKVIILLKPDIKLSDETQALKELAGKLPASIPQVWFAAPPVDMRLEKRQTNLIINDFNRLIKNLCLAQENCSFIDLTDLLTDGGGNLKSEYHTGDGRSFNKLGAKVWSDAVKSLVP